MLSGAASAAERRRAEGKRPGDNKYLTKFMQEMHCVVEHAAAAAMPDVRALDLAEVPKIIRSRIFEVKSATFRGSQRLYEHVFFYP